MADVQLEGLSKRFGEVVAVDQVTLAVAEGEFVSLLGPSGCGKTTTLRLIAGLEQPDQGAIRFGGRDVTRLPAHRRDLGMVFQNYALFPHLSVAANVAYGLSARGVPRRERPARVAAALAQVGLEGYGARRVDALSGGQQQRVALARATALQPGLLLLDEPLSNLDARLRVETRTMLRAVQRELGATAVYVTHDQEEALTLSDRIVVMRGGRIVQVGTPRELYDQPCCEYVATFLGRANLLPVTTTAGRVRLADGLVVPYPPARDSGPALLCIRPEAVRVGEVGDLPATVAGTVFNGPWIEYQLDVLGARWQAIEANRRQPWRAVGQRVALELPPEAITLLPPDAS